MAGRAIATEASSGNVFADLGLSDAGELDTKARLAVKINALIAAQRLNRATAATRLATSRRMISALKSYRLDGLSVERLKSFPLAIDSRVAVKNGG